MGPGIDGVCDCSWVRKFTIAADDLLRTQRQLRAADRSKRQMADNCHYNQRGLCAADGLRDCRMQCGSAGSRVIDGVLRRD